MKTIWLKKIQLFAFLLALPVAGLVAQHGAGGAAIFDNRYNQR